MHTTIDRRPGLAQLNLAEVRQAREMLGFLRGSTSPSIQADLPLRALASSGPFLTMVNFSVVFVRISRLPPDHVPYAVLTFSALPGLSWGRIWKLN